MSVYAYGAPSVRGNIRSQADDFQVTEAVGYEPSGEGEHLWLWVEKRAANTLDVARALARLAGVHPKHVGFAGLKDRNAVTRQPFTLHLAGRPDPDWADWQSDAFQVLSATRHQRKIQRGRLAGNRFALTIRSLHGNGAELIQSTLDRRLQRIASDGVPNGFGEQRFGGNNVARARALFAGALKRQPSRSKQGFYLSAARSLIFNRVLARRIALGHWNRLIDGDIAMLDGRRSIFAADPEDLDQRQRCADQDLHPTGPMVGLGSEFGPSLAGQIELQAAEQDADLLEGLVAFGVKAERRSLRMRVHDLSWRYPDDTTLELSFGLGRGSYATAVLREVIDYTDASQG
ncbi:MAG: tRNA pseudouridine(13) synthase TruD [Pseudomonadota bacterium]